MRYAADTEVSVEKSRAEIESTAMRYGATGFISGWQGPRAMVAFEMRDRRLKFLLPLPDKSDYRLTPRRLSERSEAEQHKAWEQACRQKWRALALAIKAKLEAVETGISTFDSEFLAHIVLPNGLTIGETILPGLPEVMSGQPMPPLLPGPPQ